MLELVKNSPRGVAQRMLLHLARVINPFHKLPTRNKLCTIITSYFELAKRTRAQTSYEGSCARLMHLNFLAPPTVSNFFRIRSIKAKFSIRPTTQSTLYSLDCITWILSGRYWADTHTGRYMHINAALPGQRKCIWRP